MIKPPGTWIAIASAILCLQLSTSSTRADYLVGVSYTSGQLVSIDPLTGEGTQAGSLPTGVAPYGLAMQGGNLYTFDAAANGIRVVDPATGSTSSPISIGTTPALGQGGLAFRSDGVGFLNTILDPDTFDVLNNLYSFNLSTGTSTLIGRTIPTLAGLAFVDNVLYGLGKLDNTIYTIDTTTALATIVGNLFADPNDPDAALGSPIESLTSGPNGQLFATLDDRLFKIDVATGRASAVGSSGIGFSSISGITYVSTVPEPSSILLVGIGMAAIFGCRRSRRPR
ncbi:PEP-CTERM sorting domain-containing protein [Tundrisphaera lichenicola]|uniref:PEP-CTERM sorting domain-containing protein n=1 Tax=Tundrisphaera lichenicola TaxID=2029860 RepID=UPI003EBAE7E0